MNHKHYDLIALDLDGTTLTPQCTITPEVKQAVQWARAQGVHVVLSTGRSCGNAAEYANELGTDDDMVTAGGATLSSARDGTCWKRISLPLPQAVTALSLIEAADMLVIVCVGEELLVRMPSHMQTDHHTAPDDHWKNRKYISNLADYVQSHALVIDKIFCDTQDLSTLATVRAAVEKLPHLQVVSSAHTNIEILSEHAGKGRALQLLCQKLGCTLDRCIAIGDSENDLEMLDMVGMPIAMGNAAPEVKAKARYITATNAENGVAQAIYYALQGDNP